MADSPDRRTIDDLKACNALFEVFMPELEKDFCELIEAAYPDSDGPSSQDMINIAFVGFCLGALAATSEDSYFLEALSQHVTPDNNGHMMQ